MRVSSASYWLIPRLLVERAVPADKSRSARSSVSVMQIAILRRRTAKDAHRPIHRYLLR